MDIDYIDVWAMRLSRQGYGDLNTMHNMAVDRFINLIHYENYLSKYDVVFRELNKK
jgi:hypothetical protein